MIFKKSVMASAIGIGVSTICFAQETAKELELTVVEAESIERDAVVEVLTVDDVNRKQINNFDDLVRLIPGVSVSKGDDRWGSSGFNIRGLDEDRVAINVDGLNQAETLKYEGGQAYGYFKGSRNGVDVEALKSIEVVKGADAILSGSGSLAGAVNMTTKSPSDLLSDNGDGFAGGFKTGFIGANDETMVSAELANRSGSFESLLVLTRREGHENENFDMNGLDVTGSAREIPDPRETTSNSVLGKLIYNISDDQRIGLVGSYLKKEGVTDSQSFNGGWYSNRVGNDINETKRYGVFHELTAETFLFDSIRTELNKQDNEFAANTAQHVTFSFGPTFSADEDRVDTRAFNQELLQVSIDLDKAIDISDSTHDLAYGLESQNKDFENYQVRTANSLLNTLGWVDRNIGALIPKSEADIVTLYALDTFNLSDKTQIRLGARFDDYTYNAEANENYADDTGTLGEVSFSTFSWTLGVEQALNSNLSLELGVSTGFRAPTIEDLYQTSGDLDDWGTIPNPDLEAEYSTNFDIALDGQFESGYFRAGVFYSQYEDFIDYVQTEGFNPNLGADDPNGYRVPSNLYEVDMHGVELSAFLDLNDAFNWAQGLTTLAQAAYTKGEQENDDPVYSVQPLNFTWTLNYDNPNGIWGASLYASYTKGKDNNDAFSTDDAGVVTYPLYLSNSATVIDLIAYYDIGDNFRITAGAYNVTDKEYYQWDNVRFVDQGDLRPGIGITDDGIKRYTEPGRNLKLSANYKF